MSDHTRKEKKPNPQPHLLQQQKFNRFRVSWKTAKDKATVRPLVEIQEETDVYLQQCNTIIEELQRIRERRRAKMAALESQSENNPETEEINNRTPI